MRASTLIGLYLRGSRRAGAALRAQA